MGLDWREPVQFQSGSVGGDESAKAHDWISLPSGPSDRDRGGDRHKDAAMIVITTAVGLAVIVTALWIYQSLDKWAWRRRWTDRALNVSALVCTVVVVLAAAYQVGQWVLPLVGLLP